MSTTDVPGAKDYNRDELGIGCWAEHKDGSMILVEGAEDKSVVYSIFDMAEDPPVEYRDCMKEKGFKKQFSFDDKKKDSIKWTWHDKTPFPWDRVMENFKSGQKSICAVQTLSAAGRVADSLNLRAQELRPLQSQNASDIMERLVSAIEKLVK